MKFSTFLWIWLLSFASAVVMAQPAITKVTLQPGESAEGTISKTPHGDQRFEWPAFSLKGPDWTTELRDIAITLKQGERYIKWTVTGSYYTPVSDMQGKNISLNFDLFDRTDKQLGTITSLFQRDCPLRPGASQPILKSKAYPANFLAGQIYKIRLTVSFETVVNPCKYKSRVGTAKTKQIILDPLDALFFFPATQEGFRVAVFTAKGRKYFWMPPEEAPLGKVLVYANGNPDILDLYFREDGSTQNRLLQNVGTAEQIEMRLPFAYPMVCVEPIPGTVPSAATETSTPVRQSSHYRLRGYYVAPPSASAGIPWTPYSIYKRDGGASLHFENVTSVQVYDPPPSSPNRLIFHFVCVHEPGLGYNRIAYVLATPSTVAQPLGQFVFIR
jgi:hypothetical protein